MNKRINKIDELKISKSDIIESIIAKGRKHVELRYDKSLYDLISLILFLKRCKNNDFVLLGTNEISTKELPKGGEYQAKITPSNFINRLEEYLLNKCDEVIQAFYRLVLHYNGEDFFSLENLSNIIEYENLKLNKPRNNQQYGELAQMILDQLNKYFWNDERNITLTQKYVLIYDILIQVKAIPIEEGLNNNDKQHKIAKYLKAYNLFIENNKECLGEIS